MTGGHGRAWLFGVVLGGGMCLGGQSGIAPFDADADFIARAQAHYARVGRELASADVSGLSADRRAARLRAIEALREYRERGDFGVNSDFPGARVPYFVDDAGRRCAVAELMHRTGDDGIVHRVAGAANHAWVADLAADAEVRSWLDRNGVSLEEAARIQAPGRPSRQAAAPPPSSTKGPDAGPTSKQSSSTGSREPEGRSAGGESSSNSGSSGSSGGSRGGDGADSRGGRDGTGGADAGSWWLWWEYAKLDFVTIHPLRLDATAPRQGAHAPVAAETALAEKRAQAVETFTAALSDDDAFVRAAAAIALGRVGGEPAVASLVPMLEDADRTVRERAILALGATGSAGGAEVLAALARHGDLAKGRGISPSPDARPLAILALGLSRRSGLATSFDGEIAKLVEDAKKRDLPDIGAAALVHGLLASGTELDRTALRAAANPNAPEAVRTRAVEAFGRRADARGSSLLSDLVGDRRLELRRSAALALGESCDPLSGAQIATAYELEGEPLTRGFLLLSLGRKGGLRSLDILRDELAHGPVALRPWAALGLGLLARPEGDIEACDALRRADLPPSAHGAVWMAQGLARDASAVPSIAKELAGASSPSERAHAATSLALIGTEEAHAALVAALATEKSEYVRVVVAWGLGSIGRDADAPALLATVESVEDAGLYGVAAVALGLHGGQACLDGALRRSSDRAVAPVARAAALEAAGLLLSRSPGLVLHETSNRTNFAVMPRWLQSALAVTL